MTNPTPCTHCGDALIAVSGSTFLGVDLLWCICIPCDRIGPPARTEDDAVARWDRANEQRQTSHGWAPDDLQRLGDR